MAMRMGSSHGGRLPRVRRGRRSGPRRRGSGRPSGPARRRAPRPRRRREPGRCRGHHAAGGVGADDCAHVPRVSLSSEMELRALLMVNSGRSPGELAAAVKDQVVAEALEDFSANFPRRPPARRGRAPVAAYEECGEGHRLQLPATVRRLAVALVPGRADQGVHPVVDGESAGDRGGVCVRPYGVFGTCPGSVVLRPRRCRICGR